MLTLKEIRDSLKDRKLTIVARETGLHYNTIRDLVNGKHDNPSYDTLSALSGYLAPNQE